MVVAVRLKYFEGPFADRELVRVLQVTKYNEMLYTAVPNVNLNF